MTRMKEKEEVNVVFYLPLGYIYLHVSLYIVCVAYPLNARSIMGNKKSTPV